MEASISGFSVLFSLDLGGEKLKRVIIIFMVVFIAISPSVLFSQDLLSSDNQEIVASSEAPSPVINEEQFIIGDNLPAADGAAEQSSAPSSFLLILRMLLVLALAAAAIYGLVYFVKKLSNPQKSEDPYLKVLSSASLGPNRSVHVVSLGGKAWLVGAADNSVSLISEIDDKETIDAMLLDNSRNSANTGMGKFIDFRSIFARLAGSGEDSSHVPNRSGNIKERRERFKGFK